MLHQEDEKNGWFHVVPCQKQVPPFLCNINGNRLEIESISFKFNITTKEPNGSIWYVFVYYFLRTFKSKFVKVCWIKINFTSNSFSIERKMPMLPT